jgi:integrase
MGYTEKRSDYWRGRFKLANGKYDTVKDNLGVTVRFRTKREAEQAANDAEAKVRAGVHRDPAAGRVSFVDYVNEWFEHLDLALSTMQGYRRAIEDHLLPAFGDQAMADISRGDIALWEKREKAIGYADASVKLWRKGLHLILADAVEDGIIQSNPASRRRGRGRRTGRTQGRGEEKTIATALGILLIAERAALLSGRDDEFVALVLDGFSGMRWGELVGLETQYLRPNSVRVEWQLYELDTGELHRCPPKDESRRTVHIPAWLYSLASDHLARKAIQTCPCHGLKYVFSGNKAAKGAPQLASAKTKDVALQAGVSVGTVSNFFNHPDLLDDRKRQAVQETIDALGYVRGTVMRTPAAHWRRNGFATWLFQPAATGWYPAKAPMPARPVPVSANPWPGIPLRGRNATGRAEACWLPIAPGLTPHSLRHSYKTLMEELGTPKPLRMPKWVIRTDRCKPAIPMSLRTWCGGCSTGSPTCGGRLWTRGGTYRPAPP